MDKGNIRASLWAQCWMAVASASNCTRKDAADAWADHMLEQFDKRFPEYSTHHPEDAA